MARHARIRKAEFRCAAAAERWGELVDIIRLSAPAPGYAGPSVAAVERVEADIMAIRSSIAQWRAKAEGRHVRVAAAPSELAEVHAAAQRILRSGRARRAMREVDAILEMTR